MASIHHNVDLGAAPPSTAAPSEDTTLAHQPPAATMHRLLAEATATLSAAAVAAREHAAAGKRPVHVAQLTEDAATCASESSDRDDLHRPPSPASDPQLQAARDAALQSLRSVGRRGLAEVIAFATPPPAVLATCSAVARITGARRVSEWSTLKQMLRAPAFIPDLLAAVESGDPVWPVGAASDAPPAAYLRSREFLQAYSLEQIQRVSRAASVLYAWVQWAVVTRDSELAQLQQQVKEPAKKQETTQCVLQLSEHLGTLGLGTVDEAVKDAYLDQTQPLALLRGGDLVEVNVACVTKQIEAQFAQTYGVVVSPNDTFAPPQPAATTTKPKKKGKKKMSRKSTAAAQRAGKGDPISEPNTDTGAGGRIFDAQHEWAAIAWAAADVPTAEPEPEPQEPEPEPEQEEEDEDEDGYDGDMLQLLSAESAASVVVVDGLPFTGPEQTRRLRALLLSDFSIALFANNHECGGNTEASFAVGDRVLAQYNADALGTRYPATIVAANRATGLYDLRWDDGDQQHRLNRPAFSITRVDASGKPIEPAAVPEPPSWRGARVCEAAIPTEGRHSIGVALLRFESAADAAAACAGGCGVALDKSHLLRTQLLSDYRTRTSTFESTVWGRASIVQAQPNLDSLYADNYDGLARKADGTNAIDLILQEPPDSPAMQSFLAQMAALELRVQASAAVAAASRERMLADVRTWAQRRILRLHSDFKDFVQPVETSTVDPLGGLDVGDEVEVLVEPTAGGQHQWAVGTISAFHQPGDGIVTINVPLASLGEGDAIQPSLSTSAAKERDWFRALNTRAAAAHRQTDAAANRQTDAATAAPAASLLVSLDPRPFHLRARAAAAVAKSHPEALAGCRVQTRSSDGTVQYCHIAAYLPHDGCHVAVLDRLDDRTQRRMAQLMDLQAMPVVHEGYGDAQVEPRSVLAPLGTHTAECLSCCERFRQDEMAEFCFQHYRVTGDSEEKRNPRHRAMLCLPCFAGYVRREIESGKLYIPCPSCPRALQMREARNIVEGSLYSQLTARVAAAEKAHAQDDASLLVAAASLSLRGCPKCGTKIEKNEGCAQVRSSNSR